MIRVMFFTTDQSLKSKIVFLLLALKYRRIPKYTHVALAIDNYVFEYGPWGIMSRQLIDEDMELLLGEASAVTTMYSEYDYEYLGSAFSLVTTIKLLNLKLRWWDAVRLMLGLPTLSCVGLVTAVLFDTIHVISPDALQALLESGLGTVPVLLSDEHYSCHSFQQ